MTELAARLSEAAAAADEVRAREKALEEARSQLRAACLRAHEAGASYGLIGRMVGLSRQRVARIAGR